MLYLSISQTSLRSVEKIMTLTIITIKKVGLLALLIFDFLPVQINVQWRVIQKYFLATQGRITAAGAAPAYNRIPCYAFAPFFNVAKITCFFGY